MALRGVGPESEAESVRFHGRRVTRAGPEVKHGPAGDWKIWMHGSIRPFQFGLPRDIKLPEAKTTNRTAFIEPMQYKAVTALLAGEKWTFEIKLDGCRCIAVKRGSAVTYSRATRRRLTNGS